MTEHCKNASARRLRERILDYIQHLLVLLAFIMFLSFIQQTVAGVEPGSFVTVFVASLSLAAAWLLKNLSITLRVLNQPHGSGYSI